MEKRYRFILLLITLFTTVMLSEEPSFAENTDSFSDNPLSVKKINTNPADNPNQNYFELSVQPNDIQEIEVEVENISTQQVKVLPTIQSAWTSDSGTIRYDKNLNTYDPSLVHEMSSYVDYEKSEITLAPSEKRILKATIHVPENISSGEYFGGWCVSAIDPSTSDSTGIVTNYGVVIGIVLRVGNSLPESNIVLEQVRFDLSNYRPAIIAHIRNTVSRMETITTIETKLIDLDNSNIVHTETQDNWTIAPNSYLNFSTIVDDNQLNTGDYSLEIMATTEDGRVFELQKDFKIDSKQLKTARKEKTADSDDGSSIQNYSNKSSSSKSKSTTLYYVVLLIIIVLFIIGAIFLIKRTLSISYEKIPRWNWGAFSINWLWGAVNGVPIMLICLIPGVNLVMSIVGGWKGYQWLWDTNKYATIQEMVQKQKIWNIIGILVFMFQLFFVTIYIIFILLLVSRL